MLVVLPIDKAPRDGRSDRNESEVVRFHEPDDGQRRADENLGDEAHEHPRQNEAELDIAHKVCVPAVILPGWVETKETT